MEGLLNTAHDNVAVVGRRGRYVGTVSLSTVQGAISEIKDRERQTRHARAVGDGGAA